MNIIVHPLRVTQLWFINYCYVIIHPVLKTALLIDPAWELETIQNTLHMHQAKLQGILLTHHHFDHINLAKTLAIQYQVPTFMSEAEINYYKFKCPNLNAIMTEDLFTVANIEVKPIFTPGHTYGGTSYLIEDNLFCGDTLFIEGCGMCLDKGANPEILFNSLQKLKILPPRTLIYPGHSYGKLPGQSLKDVFKNNFYLHFNDPLEFVKYRMRKNQKNIFNFK